MDWLIDWLIDWQNRRHMLWAMFHVVHNLCSEIWLLFQNPWTRTLQKPLLQDPLSFAKSIFLPTWFLTTLITTQFSGAKWFKIPSVSTGPYGTWSSLKKNEVLETIYSELKDWVWHVQLGSLQVVTYFHFQQGKGEATCCRYRYWKANTGFKHIYWNPNL